MLRSEAAISNTPWVAIFKGVDYASGEADANEARLQKVFALRVDLTDPDVEFFSTPSNGDVDFETTSQTTSQFLLSHGLQIAINANFFSPCCSGPEPKDLLGLAISRGEIVSPIATSGTGSEAILITRSNQALVATTTASIVLSNYWTAVAGSPRMLRDGVNIGGDDAAHPRTAVGVSQDNRYLIMIVIDGRQPGWSDGANMTEVGNWLIRFGAWNGLNLDGGGSTAMVKAQSGGSVSLNRAISGVQRSNGNNFGVSTKALAPGISAQPQSRDILQGTNVTFTVSAYGTTPLRYQWRFNGLNLAGATGTSFSINSAQLSHSGSYSVVITNGVGTVSSASAILNVNYGLTTNSTLGGVIVKSPDAVNHPPNSVVSLTAMPDPGFVFTGWSGDVSGTTNPVEITMTGHRTVTASFSGTASDIIIDNPEATTTGTWSSVTTTPGTFGTNYLSATPVSLTSTPSRLATYRPMIYTPGRYAIYEWHPIDSTRSTNAPWKVTHEGGGTSVRINQATNGGGWRLLFVGKDFVRGTNGFVQLANNASGSARVIADAIKFVRGTPATIVSHPTPVTVLAGNPASLSVSATGTEPLKYQWKKNGLVIIGATNSTYTIESAQAQHAGSYSATVTNVFGTANSSTAALVVNVPPSIVTQPQSQVVGQGTDVVFSVVANGTAPLHYQWHCVGTNIPGATGSNFVINNVQSDHAGVYAVTVTNMVGMAVSSNATLYVGATPAGPSVRQQPVSQLTIAGQSVSFAGIVNGTLPLYYQWQFNGANIAGATSSSLTLVDAQPVNAGSYMLIASNSVGTIATTAATLTVHYAVNVVSTIGGKATISPQAPSYAPGQAITLSATPELGFSFAGWSGDTSSTNNPLTVAITSNITVIAAFSGSVADIIIDNPAAVFMGDWSIGTTASGRYGPDYRFANSTNGVPTETAVYRPNIGSAGRYNVSIWYPSGSNRASNAPWTIEHADGTDTIEVNQMVNGGGWFLIGAGKPFTAGTNGFVHLSNNANNSVVIADAVKFSYVPGLSITSHPQDRTVYRGDSATFTVNASGTGPVVFQWRHNDINLPGQTNTTLTLNNIESEQAGRYSAFVSNATGSLVSLSANLFVLLPPAEIRLSAPELQPDGRLRLLLFAETNRVYSINRSTNLFQWSPLTNLLQQNNPTIILFTPDNGTRSFYRALWTQP